VVEMEPVCGGRGYALAAMGKWRTPYTSDEPGRRFRVGGVQLENLLAVFFFFPDGTLQACFCSLPINMPLPLNFF
jgi:hypothetical protein